MHQIAARLRALAPADRIALAALAAVVGAVYAGFFGRYAFDDSYVGYTIARSLLNGDGFTFNIADRTLSTSAPLAPPLYAGLSMLLGGDVVATAQIVSAIAVAIIAFGSYGLARRYSAPGGALCAAIVLVCSPFTLMLWSHETLLYAAACIVALNLFGARRDRAAAVTAGLACLLRGEALLMLPFFWYAQWKRRGARAALLFAAISLVPFALWVALAIHLFGGFASQTIASKRVQLLYPSTLPYLLGAIEYFVYTFSLDHTRIASAIAAVATGVAAYGCVANRLLGRPYVAVFIWAAATTALYAVLGMEFYFWFLVQFGAVLAVLCAAPWPRELATPRSFPALHGARVGACVLTAATLLFLILEMRRGIVRGQYWSAAVMPELHANAYKSLGLWFSDRAGPRDRIAYPEFGQLRYYSGRDLVDYLGLVSSGATAQLADGNAIWSFKHYRPQWVVEDSTWHVFVNPPEYDWFRSAYVPVQRERYPGDPTRNDFTIYRLRAPRALPAPDIRAHDLRVISLRRGARDLRIEFSTTASRLHEAEVRVRLSAACTSVRLELWGRTRVLAERSERVTPGIERLSMQLDALPPSTYALHVSGCAMEAAPRLALRRFVPRLLEPPIEAGKPADALTVYTTAANV